MSYVFSGYLEAGLVSQYQIANHACFTARDPHSIKILRSIQNIYHTVPIYGNMVKIRFKKGQYIPEANQMYRVTVKVTKLKYNPNASTEISTHVIYMKSFNRI